MGNCQAIDAAALVIQHPDGRLERLYWPVLASEVMKMNPGHYVSLIIPLPTPEDEKKDEKTVRFTRVKLLRPSETLSLGHAYRLITSQEVMKVLRAKKYAKIKQQQEKESAEKKKSHVIPDKQGREHLSGGGNSDMEKTTQGVKHERHNRPRMSSSGSTVGRSKSWRPSLHSIDESGS